MNKKSLDKISKTFEQDDYKIPVCLEYYVGLEAPVVSNICHPDHLWTLLDRIQTMTVIDNEELSEEQGYFLNHFISKWMKEIEPYCVRLECE